MKSFKTIKKSFAGLTVLFILIVLSSCGASKPSGGAAQKNLGYVDLAVIFDDYKKVVDYDARMETAGKGKEEERTVIVQDIQKLKDELSLLTDQGRADRQSELETKIKALQEFDNKAREELGTQRNELLKEIFDDIEKVVNDYADKEGYDFIFSSRSLLFQKDQYDVTKPVIRELNRQYEQKPAKAG